MLYYVRITTKDGKLLVTLAEDDLNVNLIATNVGLDDDVPAEEFLKLLQDGGTVAVAIVGREV